MQATASPNEFLRQIFSTVFNMHWCSYST